MVPSAPGVPQKLAASAAAQEPVHPVTLFGALAGAPGASADQTTSKSGDWAIQFAAPKSGAEAKVAATRLNAKYAPALKYLAWASIVTEKDTLNLDPHQARQAETHRSAAEGAVVARLPETY